MTRQRAGKLRQSAGCRERTEAAEDQRRELEPGTEGIRLSEVRIAP